MSVVAGPLVACALRQSVQAGNAGKEKAYVRLGHGDLGALGPGQRVPRATACWNTAVIQRSLRRKN